MNKLIYLDFAAATPVDPAVFVVMERFFNASFYNPSATYAPAVEVAKAIQAARERVAFWLGARAGDIYFTSGATEANNLALRGVLDSHPEGEVVVLSIEHDAILEPANRSKNLRVVPVDAAGIIDMAAFEQALSDKTVLVSVMYANNEIGTIQPLRRIAAVIEKQRAKRHEQQQALPLYFHTDASQAPNYLDMHASRLGVDMMTLNGGKMYGPKGAGVLYVGPHVRLQPQALGGGQERGLRSGTENVPGIVGLSAALDMVQTDRHQETARLQDLQRYFMDQLESRIAGVQINGSKKHRLPNNIHATFPGQDNERLQILLDEQGILCATGSACSASKEQASHVLAGLGLSEEQARASLRFTMGRQTTKEDIDTTINALLKILTT